LKLTILIKVSLTVVSQRKCSSVVEFPCSLESTEFFGLWQMLVATSGHLSHLQIMGDLKNASGVHGG
jgi:hypothetical protein